MRLGACARETELRQAVERGHWPEACPAELRAHVERCADCQALLRVMLAFRQSREATGRAARLEPPSALWWRAQLRRRHANLEQLERPLLAAKVFAALVCLLGTALFLASQSAAGWGWLRWMGQWPRALHLEVLLPADVPSQFARDVSIAMALLAAAGVAVLCIAAGTHAKRLRNG